MTSHIWRKVNTGESYIFHFGIFICCATVTLYINIGINVQFDLGIISCIIQMLSIEIILSSTKYQYMHNHLKL